MKKVQYTSQKLILSGNVFELYSYEMPILIDPIPQNKKHYVTSGNEPRKERREESSLYRAKQQLRRLVNANAGFHFRTDGTPFLPIFITFTFRDNVTELKQANAIYTKFIQRFNYDLFREKRSILKYIVSVEFQKRGAVHYHAIFFNIPYRRGLKDSVSDIWGEGFVRVESIRKNINDVGNYLTKYMTKEQFDSRLVGKKCYFSSRNLYRPYIIKDPRKIALIMRFIKPEQKVFERSVDDPSYGPGYLYQKYNVDNPGFVQGTIDLIVKGRYVDA